MSRAAALADLFSKAELDLLTQAADGIPLKGWLRHVLLSAAGQPEPLDDLDELDDGEAAPALPAPTSSPVAEDDPGPADEPTLAELVARLERLGLELHGKLTALGNVLEEIRDGQREWHKAILAEILAHTAFPDEAARRRGLAKAERDLAAAEGRIDQAMAEARRQRRSRMQAEAG